MGYLYRRKDSKQWSMAYKDSTGRVVRESSGTENRHLADQLLKKRETEVWERRHTGRVTKIKFEQMVAKALEYLQGIGRQMRFYTLRNRVLDRFFNGRWAHEITRQDVMRYQMARLNSVWGNPKATPKKIQGNTVNRELAVLRRFFNIGRKLGLVTDNPVSGVEFYKVCPKTRHLLTPLEIRRLVASAPAHIQPMIVLALHTGFRLNNVLTLRWEAVDFNRNIITLERTKGGRIEHHHMNPVVRDLLWNLHEDQPKDAQVFIKKDGSPRKSFRTAWDVARQRAGLPTLGFHDLRRTFATYASQCTDPFTVKALLGHRDLTTTQMYVQTPDQRRQEAVNKLVELYGAETMDPAPLHGLLHGRPSEEDGRGAS